MEFAAGGGVAEVEDEAVAPRWEFGPARELDRFHLFGYPDLARIGMLDDLVGFDQRLSRVGLYAEEQGERPDEAQGLENRKGRLIGFAFASWEGVTTYGTTIFFRVQATI